MGQHAVGPHSQLWSRHDVESTGGCRARSAVENWHSVLRPYLAVHRRISTGMLALLAVWHNHRVTQWGLHQGQSPLMRSGMAEVASDWLVAMSYPP